MDKRIYTIIILLALAGAAVWFLILPVYDGISAARTELAVQEKKIKEAEESKAKLLQLQEKYETLKAEEEKILSAVPNKGDVPGLLIQLEALSSQNGLILNSIDFSYPAETQKTHAAAVDADESQKTSSPAGGTMALPAALAAAPAAPSVKTLSMNLSLSGNYEAFKNFLKAVENNLRLTDVVFTNFSYGQSGPESATGKLSVTMDVYYKE